MFKIELDAYTLACHPAGLPDIYENFRDQAALAEEFDLKGADPTQCCFVGVRKHSGETILSVAQQYSPAGYGFYPGVLLVPETSVLFIGAGERLLAYDLETPKRLWTDNSSCGFWGWRRHGQFVLMSDELEFAAWTIEGAKLWTTDVDPPWSYEVHENTVVLEDYQGQRRFSIQTGCQAG